MELQLEQLTPFCTSKEQKKLLEKLSKKPFSLKSSTMRENLTDLMCSLFAEEKYEVLSLIFEMVLVVDFDGNFDIWHDVENWLSLLALSPKTSADDRALIFGKIKSVTEHKDPRAEESYDTYFARILSLESLRDNQQELQDAIDDEDQEYEWAMRFAVLMDASLVTLVAEQVDFKTLDFPDWLTAPNFESQSEMLRAMKEIISEQIREIRSEKLVKYI